MGKMLHQLKSRKLQRRYKMKNWLCSFFPRIVSSPGGGGLLKYDLGREIGWHNDEDNTIISTLCETKLAKFSEICSPEVTIWLPEFDNFSGNVYSSICRD